MGANADVTEPAALKPLPRRFGIQWLLAALLVAVTLSVFGGVWWREREHARLAAQTYAPPPEGMVLVPAGEFLMGSDAPEAEPDERPLRRVFVPAFYVDRCEVTNGEYRRFKPDHEYPEGAENLPVSHVYREEAMAYARWAGKRLPTNAEWEKAARGTDGRTFPWGDEFDPALCNLRLRGEESRGKLPVGSFPKGASPYGCLDMTGNVWEWVGEDLEEKHWLFGTVEHRRGLLRGGAHGYPRWQGRTSYLSYEATNATCNDTGFRCVKDAVPLAAKGS